MEVEGAGIPLVLAALCHMLAPSPLPIKDGGRRSREVGYAALSCEAKYHAVDQV